MTHMNAERKKPNPANDRDAGTFESLGRKLDERPEIRAAEEAIHVAQDQLRKAREQYAYLKSHAREDIAEFSRLTTSEKVESALDWVRKHPGPGVLASLACGWMLGRLFRR
jgi:hypothetical protein